MPAPSRNTEASRAMLSIMKGLRKEATTSIHRVSDTLNNMATGLLPYGIGPLATAGGLAGGVIADPTEKDIKERSPFQALIPGAGAYNQTSIAKAVDKKHGGKGKYLHEMFGPAGNLAALAGGGAALGAAIGSRYPVGDAQPGYERSGGILRGGLLGGAAGASLWAVANLAAMIAAGATPTRSSEEQAEVDQKGSRAADWLVPGVGGYNKLKRLGHGYDQFYEGAEADRKPGKKDKK